MKKIKNTSKNRLLFPSIDFSIGGYEEKIVTDEQYKEIKYCIFISLVKHIEGIVKVDKNKKFKNKRT